MQAWLQALTNVINDTLGTPLFDVKTAAAGLPLSASIQSIAIYPGMALIAGPRLSNPALATISTLSCCDYQYPSVYDSQHLSVCDYQHPKLL